jgi:hypothetical protein
MCVCVCIYIYICIYTHACIREDPESIPHITMLYYIIFIILLYYICPFFYFAKVNYSFFF